MQQSIAFCSFSKVCLVKVVVLLVLTEIECSQVEGGPFSDPVSFVNKMVWILRYIVRVHGNYGQLVCDCYDLLLEAGLHCGMAWQTFTEHDDIEELHHGLFLAQPFPAVRNTIGQLIKIKLDRFSP
jgi:hypothetical protein